MSRTTSTAAFMTPAVEKAMGRVITAAGTAGKKVSEEERKRRAAMAATLDACIEAMSEAARIAFFTDLEARATGANARRIAGHPLRAAEVDALAATKRAEIKADAEQEKAARNAETPELQTGL